MIRPSKVRKNSPFNTRIKPASAIRSILARCNSSTNARSALSSSFVRNFPGSINWAGRFRSLACVSIPDCGTSLSTMPISAGTRPAAQASAIATKLEPLPDPKTPTRNLRPPFTRSLYRDCATDSRTRSFARKSGRGQPLSLLPFAGWLFRTGLIDHAHE